MLRKLGKYELLGEIGHGGMATVYRAHDTRLDRDVAIKILHPHLRGAKEARGRFVREARSVARLRHRNILEIFDSSDEDSEEAYIATELLTGPTLRALVEEHGPMPAEVAAAFCIEVGYALSEAHASGIIHRDVKPENVLVHKKQGVKLTDFGIAQMVDSQSYTATGQILGSPGHMAPEQVDQGDCDERTDVFSLGTVLYYLATGELPFQGKTAHQVLRKVMDAEYPDPVRLRPVIGEQLGEVIRRAMERKPVDRYASAEAFCRALEELLRETGFESPRAILIDYLHDPKVASDKVHQLVIEPLLEHAREAIRVGDRARAAAFLNRVAALEPGHRSVQKLLRRVTWLDRVNRISIVGAFLGIIGVAAMGYTVFVRPSADMLASADEPDPVNVPVVTSTTTPTETDVANAKQPTETKPFDRKIKVPAVKPRGPRTVVFSPTPQNVSIGIDGTEPKPFGPSFRQLELSPGKHRVVAVGAAGCCEDLRTEFTVTAGSGPMTLPLRLKFKPAGIYVATNVPADVSVGNGLAEGRTRNTIFAQTGGRLTRSVPVKVTSDGYAPYEGRITLQAGEVKELRVTLKPNDVASP